MALLQCTSPLTRACDVTEALRLLTKGGCDSVFSLVRRRPGLQWREAEDGEWGEGEGGRDVDFVRCLHSFGGGKKCGNIRYLQGVS